MSSSPTTTIKQLYHAYRQTPDFDAQGLFFSPTCMQICRPIPTYAATSRAEIVKYAKDAAAGEVPTEKDSSASTQKTDAVDSEGAQKEEKSYTIRPLDPSEYEFSTDAIAAHVGCKVADLEAKSKAEKWVGMRVDVWFGGAKKEGLLVKVQYWWRYEAVKEGEEVEGDTDGFGWRQCFHDIIYLGPKDGTQGGGGLEIFNY
jgi:hypothetical protein